MTTLTEITATCGLCSDYKGETVIHTWQVEDADCSRCVSSAHGPAHKACRPHDRIHCTADMCF